MSQYLDKDGATRIAENFLSKQAEQDAILKNLQFDLKEVEHALVKTIQGPAPLSIRALTRPLDDYLISGNTVQNGTPTPDMPVDVQGVGVRTANIFDYTKQNTANGYVNNAYVNKYGGGVSENIYAVSEYIEITGQYVSLSVPVLLFSPAICFYNSEKQYISGESYNRRSTVTEQIPQNAAYIRFTIVKQYASTTMVNFGDTLQPFEPWGYKIPISNGQQTTNIYLGSTQTTRKIKKLVLTGNESGWVMSGTGLYYNLTLSDNPRERDVVMSTHFAATHEDYIHVGTFRFGGSWEVPTSPLVFNYDDGTIGLEAFKSYLAAQYSAGTPVTVWYVLAEPETGIVNEPLHKIGDYADTISMAQSGVEISTTKGLNTITTDTTVLPSNIEVKGVINNA